MITNVDAVASSSSEFTTDSFPWSADVTLAPGEEFEMSVVYTPSTTLDTGTSGVTEPNPRT